jgi:hypothetical protein
VAEVAEQLAGGEVLVEPEVAGQIADPSAQPDIAARVAPEELHAPTRRPDQIEQ